MELQKRIKRIASTVPESRKYLVPLLKTAGWEISNVRPGTKVTDRMVETLVIRKARYMGVIKGSLEWKSKPEFSRNGYDIEWHWSMKGNDPTTNDEYNIRGMFKLRMNMDKSYVAWIGVHI